MNKILSFFFLFLVVCYCKTYSQQFNNNYLLDKPAAVFGGIKFIDDTVYVHGYIAESYPPYPPNYILAKFDEYGNPIFGFSTIIDSTLELFTQYNFITTIDSGFAFCGSEQGSISGYFFKLRKDGSLEYYKRFLPTSGMNNSIALFKCFQLADSSYFLAGLSFIGGNQTRRVLIKIDNNGNELWRKLSNDSENIGDFFSLSNGNILHTAGKGTYLTGGTIRSRSYFMELDTSGNIIDYWIDSDNRTFPPLAYFELEHGERLYAENYQDTFLYSGNDSYSLNKWYIVKADSNYNKIWEIKTGLRAVQTQLNNMIQLFDGNFLAVGINYDTSDVPLYVGKVIKIYEDGSILWDRKYFLTTNFAPGNINNLTDAVELLDGSIIACGTTLDYYDDYPQRGWLLRLDEYGCLVPGCQHVGINESENDTRFFSIYPNPISDRLYLYFNSPYTNENYSVKIYTPEGKEITSVPKLQDHSTYIVNTQSFSKGTYIVVFFKNNQIISSQKIIKP